MQAVVVVVVVVWDGENGRMREGCLVGIAG